MSPQTDRRNSRSGKAAQRVDDRFSLHLPYEAELPPDLAAVIDAWSAMPEAVRAGIVAMVRAASPRGGH